MSRFYGIVDGSSKTAATRRGFHNLRVDCNGWNHGVEVRASETTDDKDCFSIWLTGGSNDRGRRCLMGHLTAPAIDRLLNNEVVITFTERVTGKVLNEWQQ